MILLKIAGVFYQFFLQSKDFTLSEIKRKQIEKELIDRSVNEIDKKTVNRSYFLLLNLGLIDRVLINGKISYKLTKSTKIIGLQRTIFLNIPMELHEVQFVGLNYKVVNNEEKIPFKSIFDPNIVLQVIPKISDIIKNRFISDVEKPIHRSLELWIPKKNNNKNNKWDLVRGFEAIPSLYKVYPDDKKHFFYCFWNKEKFYKFPQNDFLTSELVKSYLQIINKKEVFSYNESKDELFELLPILEPIRKVLFTHHILTTGDIPLNYRYQINSKVYKQIKRIYK